MDECRNEWLEAKDLALRANLLEKRTSLQTRLRSVEQEIRSTAWRWTRYSRIEGECEDFALPFDEFIRNGLLEELDRKDVNYVNKNDPSALNLLVDKGLTRRLA